ncbi:MAG TPA: LPS export ABC transporter permease LptG [Rhodocyclaceae bacterium]|jgi:lipopolysaccharide export system permease protein|nr:LPS export ABC transporter permease LptG [Rhodocyclaceae bacterium]HMV21222.1 LPS export ABC transporter permease LptG [Rhodocyclaceae bacterium]HMW77129.1 LPS export ABC transporter permease LptG [Rhodocyclaceae bacterium]HNE43162.1 LPS export ABC transporter permease LptG [Rhodocyclaceae bacterium]HNL22616.1 LPS export ABC transporter permease LptG [Rhodocyclaceae bacterium]
MGLKLYQRYLMRETFAAILLVLMAFLVLFSFFDLMNELQSVGKGGYQFGHALIFITLSLPGRIYELIPIAALIGTLYALSTLARHSEITVLRASGLATRDLLLTLFRIAGILAAISLVVGEGVMPFSEKSAQELRARAIKNVIANQGFRTGLWVKDGRNFINIATATPDARLLGVRIYSFGEDSALQSVTEAREGNFQDPDRWVLSEVVATRLVGDKATVERQDSLLWQSAITPDLLSVLMVAPERMSLYGLQHYTRHLAENRQKTERYDIAFWKKLIYPLASLVMVALALPFAYSHNRVGGVSLKIFAGVMIGILFHMLNGLFSSLGVINAWPAFASAATPSAIFLVAAMGMLWWVERR